MKNWKMILVVLVLVLSQILAACGAPAATATEAAPPPATEEATEAAPEPTVEPSPTTPPEPGDIEL